MAEEIYSRLARHLDGLPGGFPPTETGVELRILRRLFTEEEAELAMTLTLIPEEARVVALRAGLPVEEAGVRLDALASKGLIYSMQKEGYSTKYMAAQFVVGIWEYHVNDLDEELVRDMNEYVPYLTNVWEKVPQLRTIPVEKSLTGHQGTLPHDKAAELIKGRKRYLVAPCICRREHKMAGEGCDRPEEACLVFDGGVQYYERNGLGRVIDETEALRILAEADGTGLVVQPSNSKEIINICLCCGCCCQVLKGLKRHPEPGRIAASPYVVELDETECVGCAKCEERCPMEALSIEGEKAALVTQRCIGCGLCVSTCPTGALVLSKKPDPPKVPKNFTSTMIKLGRARGKLTVPGLAITALRSKLDRLKAARSK